MHKEAAAQTEADRGRGRQTAAPFTTVHTHTSAHLLDDGPVLAVHALQHLPLVAFDVNLHSSAPQTTVHHGAMAHGRTITTAP
jgi:hypothetical protein